MISFFQLFHRIDEAAIGNGDDQVYRIEVFLAIKTSRQVGFRGSRRMKAGAQRASKTQQRIAVADIQSQHIHDDGIDWDPVS
jgi:hypothetical protein